MDIGRFERAEIRMKTVGDLKRFLYLLEDDMLLGQVFTVTEFDRDIHHKISNFELNFREKEVDLLIYDDGLGEM